METKSNKNTIFFSLSFIEPSAQVAEWQRGDGYGISSEQTEEVDTPTSEVTYLLVTFVLQNIDQRFLALHEEGEKRPDLV